jgi:hypothetical protein
MNLRTEEIYLYRANEIGRIETTSCFNSGRYGSFDKFAAYASTAGIPSDKGSSITSSINATAMSIISSIDN